MPTVNLLCTDTLPLRAAPLRLAPPSVLLQAESWAKAHPEEMVAAYKRKADIDAAEWKVFVDSMAEQGFTYDPQTDKFWGIDEESGELYEYKSPEQEAAEAAAWGLFKDKKTGKKYQFNELTGEIVWLD